MAPKGSPKSSEFHLQQTDLNTFFFIFNDSYFSRQHLKKKKSINMHHTGHNHATTPGFAYQQIILLPPITIKYK